MESRVVDGVFPSDNAVEGRNTQIRRVFGSVRSGGGLDPFVRLDEWDLKPGSGFPRHPHRGVCALTYIIEGGVLVHPQEGTSGVLSEGDVFCVLCGTGIVHSEMAVIEKARTRAIHIWINVASDMKHQPPSSVINLSHNVKELISPSGKVIVRVLSGNVNGCSSIIQTCLLADVMLLSTTEEYEIDVGSGTNSFVYVLDGSVGVSGQVVKKQEVALLDSKGKGSTVILKGEEQISRCIVAAAPPVHEKHVKFGPFIMNSPVQLLNAIEDYLNSIVFR